MNFIRKRKAQPGQKSSEWVEGRFYLVPRDMAVSIPKGYHWAAAGQLHRLGEGWPVVQVQASDWGQDLAPLIRMIAVVPAVSAHGHLTGHYGPFEGHMPTRKARFLHMRRGDVLTLTAASSRRGEVLVVPLRADEPSSHANHPMEGEP